MLDIIRVLKIVELVVLFYNSLASRFVLLFYGPKFRRQLAKFLSGQTLQLELLQDDWSKFRLLFSGSFTADVRAFRVYECLITCDHLRKKVLRYLVNVVWNFCTFLIILVSDWFNIFVKAARKYVAFHNGRAGRFAQHFLNFRIRVLGNIFRLHLRELHWPLKSSRHLAVDEALWLAFRYYFT